jgi:hypothetical protein
MLRFVQKIDSICRSKISGHAQDAEDNSPTVIKVIPAGTIQ